MGWFSWWTEGKRHTVQRSLEGVGLADFSDIGPTLELHDELKSLEGEAQHLTATVKEALAHARRHAIAMSRSLCPPQTAATAGRTPPEDSPVGLALKAAVDDFSTRVHREVIRFSQGAETPASVTSGHSRATTVTVVPGAVFSGLQAATQCAKVTESRIEELKLIRLDFDSYRRKAAKAQAKVDAARAQGEGAGMTERQARYLEKLQDHLLRRKQKLAECGEAFDRLEDDLVREMETSKAAVVPMLQQAPHNFLELQAAFHARLADAAAQFTQSGGWADTPPIADSPHPDFSPRRAAYSDVDAAEFEEGEDEDDESAFEETSPDVNTVGNESDWKGRSPSPSHNSPEGTPEPPASAGKPGTSTPSPAPSPQVWTKVGSRTQMEARRAAVDVSLTKGADPSDAT
uniref:BAR domain-containing protein n=1 Tax=Prasinoderma coloniale TaxID=156133 RepID=A0A7R9TTZ6_9VIRI|mmetsp:Transcript_6509/g.26511  ORF Transcript_6509/g.26511 Transcript_6509/m.26511 type:complete len:403 (+) Transcript_6509:229-1437(+)